MFFRKFSCKKIIVCYYALAMTNQVHLFDKISNQTLYKGEAIIDFCNNDGLLVTFKNDTHQFKWKIWQKGLVIRSESEIIVNLTLGHIETEFGIIDVECHTTLYNVNENCVEVKYSLIQGKDKQEFHFVLYINKEDMYAVN